MATKNPPNSKDQEAGAWTDRPEANRARIESAPYLNLRE